MIKQKRNEMLKLCIQSINRAMALSISLMFGRFGGVAGSNTAAFLLDNHCEAAFYLSGSVVTGNCFELKHIRHSLIYVPSFFLQYCSNGIIGILHSQYS